MDNRGYIVKAQPNYFFLSIYLIGAIFFAFWSKVIYFAIWKIQGASEKTGDIIILSFLSLFILFTISCIICLVSFRVFILTESELIVKRPLLFIDKTVLLSDIMSITEKDITINLSKSMVSDNQLTIGKKAIISRANNRKVNISSIEIKGADDYKNLIRKIYKGMRV